MSDEDDDQTDVLTLRDKLAMAALPSLIQRYNDKVNTKWVESGAGTAAFKEDAKNIALMAYKIADEMRKVRLQAFT